MPDWARGRMNAVHMMVSQGGVALGAILWGGSTIYLGLGETLVGGAILLASFIGSSTNGPIINNLESEIILTSGDSSIGGKVAVGHHSFRLPVAFISERISTYIDADPISPPLILFSDNLSGRAKVKGTTDSLFI
jgi:Transmembrane secretion effector